MPYKTTLKGLSALLLLLLLGHAAHGQKKISFQPLHDGLSNYHIKYIFQDSKGFMWFSTFDGLNKFDGNHFTTYESSPLDSTTLCDNFVNIMVEDKDKNIWIGTASGLNIYNRDKDNFSTVSALQKSTSFCVTTLLLDDHDNLWVGSYGRGLFIYNIKSKKVISFTTDKQDTNTISSNVITGIVKDRKHRIWIGTRNGLNLYNDKTKTFRHLFHNDQDPLSLTQNSINALSTDKEGNVWVATIGEGLNQLVEHNGRFTFKTFTATDKPGGLSNNHILSLCPDRKGNLWIGTENGGLNYLHIQSGIFEHFYAEDGNPKALASNSIWSVFEDKDGILWIGTYNKGINMLDERFNKFEVFQKNYTTNRQLTNNDIKDFKQGRSGTIWIATDGGGICGFNPETRQFLDFPGNNKLSTKTVISLLIDNKGNFWAGTWSFGIDRFDKNGNKVRNYKCATNKTTGGKISCLYQDKKGNIFVGTSGNGLFRYDPQADDFISIVNKAPNSQLNENTFISQISEDSQHNIWIGTFYGLMRMAPNGMEDYKFTQYFHDATPESLCNSRVKTVFEDSRKRIWVGTENGLDLMTNPNGSFTHIDKQNGLPNSTINGILEDNHGNLWIGTNKGVTKFNPDAMSFQNFTKEDGLCSNETSMGTCLKTPSGSLLFGGSSGFNMICPDNIQFNTHIPSVYITDISISNCRVKIGAKNSPLQKNISETKEITLTHEQNSFTIEFVAINYTRPSKNQYKYMLEGFDKTWVNSGTQHSATYTNMNAGKYTFRVMGSNNDGVWSVKPCVLEIKVLPPFWKTPWAYLVYFIIIGALVFSFMQLWKIKTEQEQRLKYEKLQRKHEDELNKLKMQFFTNISHELRTPLTLIISPLEHILSSGDITGKLKQQLGLAFKNTERLFRLVNELMDFSKSEENKLKLQVKPFDMVQFVHDSFHLFTDEAKLKHIDFTFETDADIVMAWADQNKLEKVFTNLLSNAFKYTPENGFIKVKITVPATSNTISIAFINSGHGISPEYLNRIFDRFFQVPDNETNNYTGTGIGLALVKNIMDLHHGTINVTSEIDHQTCFTVTLLLGKDHFDEASLMKESDNGNTVIRKQTVTGKKTIVETDQKLPHVLIVEDNAELRSFLVSVLNEAYQVTESSDGEAGWILAEETNPDLIISDIIMPKMSGIELCTKIKKDIATSHIPVILLTSKGTIENQIEGIENGADMYITKPFNVTQLKAIIKNLIEIRRKLFQRFSQDVYLLPKEITTNKYDQKFLEQAIGYIQNNIENEDISVEGLSASLTMNRSNVYRKIKALTGQSVAEFIRTVRLKQSIKYLEEGELNIAEIAYKVGFNSPAYFTKCFKGHFDKLPSEFLPKKIIS